MSQSIQPSHALALLREQHDHIRLLADRCDELATPLSGDATVTGELARAVASLRIAVGAHNRDEEALLGPILLATDSFGPVRAEEMVRGHASEHRLLVATLDAATAGAVRAVIAQLRAHLAAEEAMFLSHRIVHDDLVVVEGSA